tara:strand:- start:225 stop:401 length:177 start_codon:yes stop_codon:yes gene_type:complete
MKQPKAGDLVYDHGNGKRGIILTWLSLGGEMSLWSIMYEDGEIDSASGNEIEVINESR